MAFEVQEFQDLVRLLREHPEWREELRTLLLTQELLTLPSVVRELAEAVAGLTESVRLLIERIDRLEETQRGMLEVQRHLIERVDRLEETQRGMLEVQRHLIERVDRLEETQRGMLEVQRAMQATLSRVVRMQEGMLKVQQRLVDQVGELQGWALEQRYRTHASAYFGRLLRRIRVVESGELAEGLEDRLAPGELQPLLLADVILRGQLRGLPEPPEVWVVMEVSSRVDRRDVERAEERAALLRRLGYAAVAAVAGKGATQGAQKMAEKMGVVLVVDGRVLGWEKAVERVCKP